MKYVITFICLAATYLMSCATYKALPAGVRSEGYSREIQKTDDNVDLICGQKTKTKYFCQSTDELFYAEIDPFQAVPCQEIDFAGTCGKANSGSLFWDFGSGVTTSLKKSATFYKQPGEYDVNIQCEFVNGTVRTATIKVYIQATQQNNVAGGYYSSFPYWFYGAADVTDIKPGETSCPRIELK